MRIMNNIMAMNAHRQLSVNQTAVFEGYREALIGPAHQPGW
jgi:hypothetical protein